MKVKQIGSDTRGTAIVEYAIALPLFTLVIFGLIWVGLVMWTQFSLQRSVGLAARCATAAENAGTGTVECASVSVSAPPSVSGIKTFAAAQYYGLGTATFSVTLNTTCGSNTGNLVSASYTFTLISLYFLKSSPTLTAQSCYPI
jgi:Flp pilus assembly protein TadG